MTRQITTINPATEEVVNTYEIMTKEQIKEKTKKAQNALSDWKKDIQKRVDHIYDCAQELRKNKEVLARTVTKEMGKAIKESRSEVEKCAWDIYSSWLVPIQILVGSMAASSPIIKAS